MDTDTTDEDGLGDRQRVSPAPTSGPSLGAPPPPPTAAVPPTGPPLPPPVRPIMSAHMPRGAPAAPARAEHGWSRVPWRTWEAATIGIVGFAGSLVISLIAVVAFGVAGLADVDDLGPAIVVLMVAPAVTVLGVLLLWIGGRYGRDGLAAIWRPTLQPVASVPRAIGWAVGAIALWAVVVQIGLGSLVDWRFPGLFDDVQAELGELAAGDRIEVVALVIGAVVLAPLWEEVFFRGLLFTAMHRRFGFAPAAIVSSLAFGLVHVEGFTLGSAYLVLQTGLLGLLFAWLLRRTGTLLAPMAAHALNNLFAVSVLLATS